MSESAEMLALRKQLLLARCRLCRLQLDTGVAALRDRLSWGHAGLGAIGALPAVGLGLALAALARRLPTPPPAHAEALLRFIRLAGFLTPLFNLLLEITWTKKPKH